MDFGCVITIRSIFNSKIALFAFSAFCGPRVHHGTLLLAMRILANLLRYPPLVAKFRGGSANAGWLSDADSVIRNRAAVRLIKALCCYIKYKF